MNVYAKQTHRYQKQTCGYQRGEGRWKEQIKCMELTDINYYKIDKQQAYIVLHRE